MAYTHTTRAQLKTSLLARLDDASAVFWTNTGTFNELDLYINEALRTWGSLTGFYRDRAIFNTVDSDIYYDLTSVLTPAHRSLNILDQDIIALMQYHLLEPATPTAWSGTDMFILSDLTNALQRRQNQFLYETGIHLSERTQVVQAKKENVALDDTVIDIRRAGWKDTSNNRNTLWREDEWALSAFNPKWNVDADEPVPNSYSVAASPPLGMRLAIPPISTGTLELLTVETGTALNPSVGVTMSVPDDLTWVLKWGALADLLGQDGQARDVLRAQYCERRWREGLEIARIYPSVVHTEINGVESKLDSVLDLDSFEPSWQNGTDTPIIAALAGLNLMAFSPVPDDVFSATVDIVKNTPVPLTDAGFIQVGREEIDVILDYAFHLSLFKSGGAEFAATIPHYERIVRHAAIYNDKLKAAIANVDEMAGRSHRETKQRLRRESDLALDTETVGG